MTTICCPTCHGPRCAHCGFCADSTGHDDQKMREHLINQIMIVLERDIKAQARTFYWRQRDIDQNIDSFAKDVARNSAVALLETIIGQDES